MGSWGQGARSALPMVGELFQQALKNQWIDPKARFDIPRTRPAPPAPPDTVPGVQSPVLEVIETIIEGIREQLR
jgi:penicillin-binding protein 1A